MIWGRHPAQAALESDRPIHRIWCTPDVRFSPKFLQLLREAKASGVLVEEVTWARLGQLTGGAVHQGIVLQTAAAETFDLGTLVAACSGLEEPPLLMALDGLTDPHNLGAIVRSAEALGAHGLVLPQRRSAGLTGSVAKVAAGALEHLPVARVVNLNRSLETLKQEGYRIIGLAEEGSVSLMEADLDGPLVIVTGSEGDGLSMLTRKHCDQLVRIPLRGATPSLNASVATALLLYEVARRGWMRQIRGSSPAPRLVRPKLRTVGAEPAGDASLAPSASEVIDSDGFESVFSESDVSDSYGSASDDFESGAQSSDVSASSVSVSGVHNADVSAAEASAPAGDLAIAKADGIAPEPPSEPTAQPTAQPTAEPTTETPIGETIREPWQADPGPLADYSDPGAQADGQTETVASASLGFAPAQERAPAADGTPVGQLRRDPEALPDAPFDQDIKL